MYTVPDLGTSPKQRAGAGGLRDEIECRLEIIPSMLGTLIMVGLQGCVPAKRGRESLKKAYS